MYKLSNLAADDFAAIYEYTLLNFGARQADAYTDDLENALRILPDAPLMGHECPEIADEVRRHDHQRHLSKWSRCGILGITKRLQSKAIFHGKA